MVSSRALQLKGQRFGRLIAIEIAGKQRKMNTWRCICDCGNETITTATRLKSGKTRSCGCLAGERHGMAGTRTYRIWGLMKDRCNNPKSRVYAWYGGRGIKVCDRWNDSFSAFFEDMGECPPNLSIDRIDPNGHYEPNNCRWATDIEQARNTRTNRILTIDGQSKTVAEWSEITGISTSTIHRRLVLGWSDDETLKTDVAIVADKRFIEYQGETHSISEWAKITGIPGGTIRRRVDQGWPLDKLLAKTSRNGKRILTYQGKSQDVTTWALEVGIKKETIYARIRSGWSVEKILTTPV